MKKAGHQKYTATVNNNLFTITKQNEFWALWNGVNTDNNFLNVYRTKKEAMSAMINVYN